MTARPPARVTVQPASGEMPGSDDVAHDELPADTRIKARAPRAERRPEWPAQFPAAPGSWETWPREPPRVTPAPEARVDSLPRERPDLIRGPDNQSPSSRRSGSGTPIPVEGRRARPATESPRPALVPVARRQPADVPHPARDASVPPSPQGAVPDDVPQARDDGPGIRPRRDVQSRVSPIGSGDAASATPTELSPQTVVRVSIGRVDVRATPPVTTPAAPARAVPPTPRLTLDAYLERAGAGRRR